MEKLDNIKEIYEKLLNCDWFENCGTNNNCIYNFNFQLLSKKSEVVKNINSLSWENYCLEQIGNLTEFLSKNHKNIYEDWNINITKLRKEYIPNIAEKIYFVLENEDKIFIEKVTNDILSNIINIFMSYIHTDYYNNIFFKNIFDIYLSGHLPCNIYNSYEGKKLLIF